MAFLLKTFKRTRSLVNTCNIVSPVGAQRKFFHASTMPATVDANINKIFIENLPKDWTSDKVAQNFSSVGNVMKVNFVKAKTGEFTGKAVVTFEEESSVDKAVLQLNNSAVDLSIIKVRPFLERKGASVRSDKSKLKRRVYLMNLPYDIVEEHIRLLVKEFAEIEDIVIPRNKDGLPTGYAFVYLKKEEDVAKIKKYVDGRHLRGRKISVKDSLLSNNSERENTSLKSDLGISFANLLKEEDTDEGIDYAQKFKSILAYVTHINTKGLFHIKDHTPETKGMGGYSSKELSDLLHHFVKKIYESGRENGSFDDFYTNFVKDMLRNPQSYKQSFVEVMKDKEKEDRDREVFDKKYPTLARINKLVDKFNEQQIFTSEKVAHSNP